LRVDLKKSVTVKDAGNGQPSRPCPRKFTPNSVA
jgi:hypothetical protein